MRSPQGVERNYPLARLTTVRTGGNAEFFVRVATESELCELLYWTREEGHELVVVGSGSNMLVADEGIRGLVLKLDGQLAAIERSGSDLVCGGGARLPSAAALAAREGLSGLEFGVNIPGTVGGAVTMNANAYGGELAAVLKTVNVATADGVDVRDPEQFDFRYRSSNLRAGEVVSEACFRLSSAETDAVKAELAQLRQRRHEAQPSGIKTFGSTFKNPETADGRTAGQLLEAADCQGLRVGDARFSPKHANFVENLGEATTADLLALMAEGRRRVYEKFGVVLEPEVQIVGDVTFPPEWELL